VTGNATLSNGVVNYASPASGSDSFSYTVEDQLGDMATGTINVTVDPGPTAATGSLTVGHNRTLDETAFVNGLVSAGLAGDTETIVSVTGNATLSNGVVSYASPASGTDSFSYTVEDQLGDTATGTVNVTVDPGPTAATGSLTVGHNRTLDETAFVKGLVMAGLAGDAETIVSVTGGATLSNGKVSYTSLDSGADSFTYTVQDQLGDVATGTVNVTVDSGPSLTAASVAKVGYGQSVAVANATAGLAGDALSLVVTTAPTYGTLALANGVVTYAAPATPPAGGASDSFSYQVKDQHGDLSSTVTTTLQIDPGPTAATGSLTVGHNQTLDETAFVNGLVSAGLAGDSETIVSVTGYATLSNGVISCASPTSGSDSFTYTAQDQLGDTATGTVHVTVDSGPGLTAASVAKVGHGQSVVVANATAGLAGDVLSLVVMTAPTYGALTLLNGVVTYAAPATTPAGGASESFAYQVRDQYGDLSSTVTTNLQIDPGPAAATGSLTVGHNQTLDETAFINGLVSAGLAGDSETIFSVSGRAMLSNGKIFYTSPDSGSDSFAYTVADQLGDTATGTVDVTVDSGPGLTAASVAKVGHGQSVVVANATAGLAGDVLSLVVTTAPTYGALTLLNGVVTYAAPVTTPAGGASDTFAYQVKDQYGDLSAAVTTNLQIDPGPKAGVAKSTVKVGQTINLTSTILGAATPGLAGDTLTIFSDNAAGALGSIALANGTLTYTATSAAFPNVAANGPTTDSFSYTITDQYGDTATGAATISIASATAVTINGPVNGSGVIQGTSAPAILNAYGYGNTIKANGGNDVINAGDGSAIVYAGGGNVVVNLNGTNNQVSGTDGKDVVSGSSGNTSVTLGNGADKVSLGGSNNYVKLGDGADFVSAGDGSAQVILGNGSDTIIAGGANNVIKAGDGNDTVTAGSGGDTVTLGNGADSITLSGYGNTVTAGNGDDTVTGGAGGATITLGNGANIISTDGTGNIIRVGDHANVISAGSGNDTVTTGNGNNTITLAGYNNVVTLGTGTNIVNGGAGGDRVTVAGGKATITFNGWSDHAILNGGAGGTIYDNGYGLEVDIGSSSGVSTIAGFDHDYYGVIDLLNHAGGFATVGAVVAALKSDGHGGSLLSLGSTGSVDILNVAPNKLTAANFRIG
jgi:hypothetical protein